MSDSRFEVDPSNGTNNYIVPSADDEWYTVVLFLVELEGLFDGVIMYSRIAERSVKTKLKRQWKDLSRKGSWKEEVIRTDEAIAIIIIALMYFYFCILLYILLSG